MNAPDESRSEIPAHPHDTGGAFDRLRDSGERSGMSLTIGMGFVRARDALARGMIRLGIRPNHCTLAGFFLTCGAGGCLALGAGHVSPIGPPVDGAAESYWPLAAGILIFLASAADMLDGSLARQGAMQSRFGELLDSSLDRLSDMALFLGIAWYFAAAGNLTYTILTMVGLCNWVLISYIKARAEDLIPDCSVGYWLRGERMAAVLIALLSSHCPALLWQQAIFPAFTVWRRMNYAGRVLRAQERGRPEPPRGPMPGALRFLAPWRSPRGSGPYDLVTGAHIAFLIFGPMIAPALYGASDPFRSWMSSIS